MDEQAILKDLMELFPVENQVVPFVELKFRLGPKYGDDLDPFLKKMVDNGILARFEFNNTVHYKSKKDIPVKLSGGNVDTSTSAGGDQLKDLSELVLALADQLDNQEITDLVASYKSKYP